MAVTLAPVAAAHEEREVTFPDGSGSVPDYRTGGPDLLVCKTDRQEFERRIADFPERLRRRNLQLFERCQNEGFRHLQAAVNQVDEPGANIAILPGVYREQPSLAPPPERCTDLDAPKTGDGYQVLSYDQQVACPHRQNLVAILGIEDLQITGTGADARDVVIDAQFKKLNAIRADRADGIYLRNFTVQRTTFNSVYIIETDGFVIDRMIGRWNDEYGFLTFAVDHGLYTDCEAYGNGDSGIYPGSASDINVGRGHDVERYAVEITGCESHHNLLGYSGTAGNSVWAHDNLFFANSAGIAMDSAFPDHPGLPQDHGLFEDNRVFDNNQNYYKYVRDGTCAKPSAERGYRQGVVCPATGVPVGTGILTAGGNYNVFRNNWVFDNDHAGFVLFWVPAFIRGETGLTTQFDTSHHNRYTGNHLGVTPFGGRVPNGMSFWWDGQGAGNCWQPAGPAGSDPRAMPACHGEGGSGRYLADPAKLPALYVCSEYSLDEQRVPAGCPWYGASGLGRVDVQLALGGSAVLALFAVLLWARRLRGSLLGLVGTAAGLLGCVAGVFGAMYGSTLLTPAALVLLAGWWLCAGVVLRGTNRGLGWFTVALGFIALADAFDQAVLLIPVIPFQPAWLRLALTAAWVLWVLPVLAMRPPRARTEEAAPLQVAR